MDSALCNNIISVPFWSITLFIALLLVLFICYRVYKYQEQVRNIRIEIVKKNKKQFDWGDMLLALVALVTALFGFFASDNITYSFTINQTCIVSPAFQTPEPTVTPLITVAPTNTIMPSSTHTSTVSPTLTNTFTPMPSSTHTSTVSPSPTNTFTPMPSSTYTSTASPSPTNTFTATPSDTATSTLFPTNTSTPTVRPTNTATPIPPTFTVPIRATNDANSLTREQLDTLFYENNWYCFGDRFADGLDISPRQNNGVGIKKQDFDIGITDPIQNISSINHPIGINSGIANGGNFGAVVDFSNQLYLPPSECPEWQLEALATWRLDRQELGNLRPFSSEEIARFLGNLDWSCNSFSDFSISAPLPNAYLVRYPVMFVSGNAHHRDFGIGETVPSSSSPITFWINGSVENCE